jgi:hypothetical protein
MLTFLKPTVSMLSIVFSYNMILKHDLGSFCPAMRFEDIGDTVVFLIIDP